MRQEVAQSLDRIESLRPGQGLFDAYLYGTGNLHSGQIGAGVEYGHRINDSWSAFADAKVGYQYGDQHGLMYQALTGVRWRGK
jgi:hypothetical protein